MKGKLSISIFAYSNVIYFLVLAEIMQHHPYVVGFRVFDISFS